DDDGKDAEDDHLDAVGEEQLHRRVPRMIGYTPAREFTMCFDRFRRMFASAGLIVLALVATLVSARTQTRPRSAFDALHFRDIGPAATGGRIHDLQIDPKDPAVLYVGAASGGIFKSTNNGVTWRDIFGSQNDNTFGSLAIFEGDSRIIWAGSGENNNRQSSSWCGGVYRSTDAGATWTYLGLTETASIGRVRAHPTNS